jgi:hypothetical protein
MCHEICWEIKSLNLLILVHLVIEYPIVSVDSFIETSESVVKLRMLGFISDYINK